MLDYAQLGAGQFRKFESLFSLPNAISDIIKVLDFKAKEMGIEIIDSY